MSINDLTYTQRLQSELRAADTTLSAQTMAKGLLPEKGVEPSTRRQLLLDAADTIDGDRNDTYGGPESSFKAIATMWSAYLESRGFCQHRPFADRENPPIIYPHDVAAMMAMLKIARIATTSGKHKDSWLDLAGYAACGWEVAKLSEGTQNK